MMKILQSIFKIHELRKRILFTLGILIIYRIGGHVPVPGIFGPGLIEYFKNIGGGGLADLYDMFAGGAFKRATVFALGIMPYISASIIIQLLGAVVPYFQKLQKEGEEGRKKITQLTRYGTVLISALQAFGIAKMLVNLHASRPELGILTIHGVHFYFITIITLASGTVFIMWLGEQITERGIGNGISLIIFIGIIARLPNALIMEGEKVIVGIRPIIIEVILIGVMVLTVAAVVLLTQGTRKIPVQYAKRVIGRKIYGGQSTHIPLRVNTAGVMPIIFAQSIMFLPTTITQFFPQSEFFQSVARSFGYDSLIYWLVYGTMIVFFTYFYTAIAFNPIDVADNMKKYGGFIPGVRPGKKTSEFIDKILTRITLPGSIFLALIAIFPYFLSKITEVGIEFSSFFGGTSLLIIVGVALDTLQQIESHLLMRHYDGFMKSGKLRGRRG